VIPIVQIPYALIGNIVAAALIIAGFLAAETGGRIAIVLLAGATLVIPKLAASPTVGVVCFTARILLAIGCALYVKWRNSAP
jgi:hypothetical protein